MKESKCDDKKCYICGNTSVRGGRLTGKIISMKSRNTVIVERSITKMFKKYERYAKERSHIAAHRPGCLKDLKLGDLVELGETRKLSKTKAWTILKVIEGLN